MGKSQTTQTPLLNNDIVNIKRDDYLKTIEKISK